MRYYLVSHHQIVLYIIFGLNEVNKRKNEIENSEVTLVNGDEVFKNISSI